MARERIESYADHYVQSTERHPMEVLAGIVEKRGWGKRRIGVEMDTYYFSAKAFAVLQERLPHAASHDATYLVNWQRAVNSPQELAYMEPAARLHAPMHHRLFQPVSTGPRPEPVVAGTPHPRTLRTAHTRGHHH